MRCKEVLDHLFSFKGGRYGWMDGWIAWEKREIRNYCNAEATVDFPATGYPSRMMRGAAGSTARVNFPHSLN